ncbi:hypothetical protein GCM10020369_01840 [Cryptosporangium minutisporangium]|uniref:Uncharacterized protein n=1 Tax=Cryptosporangium minutisporangium TaxID=113569 RepID=A0ABP6SP73_9ACTN
MQSTGLSTIVGRYSVAAHSELPEGNLISTSFVRLLVEVGDITCFPNKPHFGALKRRLSGVVYRTMLNDAMNGVGAGGTDPGGQPGTTTDSSAADSNPDVDASEKSLPGPAKIHPTTPRRAAS